MYAILTPMSTMQLETHILSQFRLLPESLRLQAADYIDFLVQRHSSPKQEMSDVQTADDSFDERLKAIIERDKPLLDALAKA